MPTVRRHAALALLEFGSVASGVSVADRMVKGAPIALLRAGTVHPGRFLVLVGGSVGSTEGAFQIGHAESEPATAPLDAVFLGDVHPALHDAILGERLPLEGDALVVVETSTSPALLRAIDAAIKGTSARVAEVRLADDLGGRAVALLSAGLTEADAALEICRHKAGEALFASALLPRLDDNLRRLLEAGSLFGLCEGVVPEGAEHPEEVACSWDA